MIGLVAILYPDAAPASDDFLNQITSEKFWSKRRQNSQGAITGFPQDGRGKGGVITYCVRLCDGYYWPMNFRPAGLRRADVEALCAASCRSPARLFRRYGHQSPIENMHDRFGKRYGTLDAAFAYRKALVPNCACKPHPHDEEEHRRHETYADVVAEGKLASHIKTELRERIESGRKRLARQDGQSHTAAAARRARARRKGGGSWFWKSLNIFGN